MHPHAAANPVWRRQLGILRSVNVAFLDIEAIEPQQRGFPAADIGRHVDGDTLVRMILRCRPRVGA
jgi:hypothetical protein